MLWSQPAIRHSINVCAFAASVPHFRCAASCPEYKCSRADARSFLPPGTSALITMQGLAFPPMASASMLFQGAAPAPMQSASVPLHRAAMPTMAGVPLLSQSTPHLSAYIAPPAWPMFMPSYLPQPQMEQSSTQAELEQLEMQRQELEARELEVERRTRAVNLNAVTDAETESASFSVRSSRICTSQEQAPIKPKCVSFQLASQRSLPPKKGFLSGIKVTSMVTTKTVKPPPTSPRSEQDGTGQAQDFNAMMQDMIRSSLTVCGVIPKANTPSQSPTVDQET